MNAVPPPGFAAFREDYERGVGHLVWIRGVADLETPVAAFLKLAHGKPNTFLLESVEGGASRGRYSIIGLEPDLVWRCRGGQAEINRDARSAPYAFVPDGRPPLDSLRALIAESRLDVPEGLPPMCGGADRLSRLRHGPPDGAPAGHESRRTSACPRPCWRRPTLFAIFDNVTDLLTLAAPVYPRADMTADRRLGSRPGDAWPKPRRRSPARCRWPPRRSPCRRCRNRPRTSPSRASSPPSSGRRNTSRAGDVFQVVPSQRFSVPFALPPFALYRALRRINPAPFLFFLDFGGFAVVGSSPGNPGPPARRHRHHPPARRHPPPRRHPRGRPGAWPPNCSPTPRSAPST